MEQLQTISAGDITQALHSQPQQQFTVMQALPAGLQVGGVSVSQYPGTTALPLQQTQGQAQHQVLSPGHEYVCLYYRNESPNNGTFSNANSFILPLSLTGSSVVGLLLSFHKWQIYCSFDSSEIDCTVYGNILILSG